MRLSLVVGLGLVSLAAMTGCATAGQERVLAPVDDPPPARGSGEAVELTEAAFTPVESAPVRPRLGQTLTLGQGATEAVYNGPPPQQSQGTTTSSNVVVNNNITVVGGTPVYGGFGGYGGYGYGGFGGRDYGRGTSSTSRSNAWAPTGWEGAGRTAGPGRTPGVGGNFHPAPSHGPRAMR